ncbi:MAG: Sapep family Mn(2+)-dependent dipeptidase [bacterium]|nr:Sapep family Mn(2+)-dependent dipeptidase [bacterium]
MDNFISDLFDILRINTIYNNDVPPFGSGNVKCLNHMLELGKNNGFYTKNLDNYCGYIEYGKGNDILGILCHLDVVDVNIDKWNNNPFDPVIKDNKIYARGAMDDKGSLMAAFYALKELKEENFIPSKRIRLIMGCNEESGSLCMKHYKEVDEEPTISFSPDAEYPVIFGEKGILTIKISGKINSVIKELHAGVKFNIVPDKASVSLNDGFKKEYIGKSAHAMNPSLGINAISLLVDDIKTRYNDIFINFLGKYFTNDTKAFKINSYSFDNDMLDLTANLAILDVKDNEFSMIINYRTPKFSDYDSIINNINKIIKDYNYKLEVLDYMEPHIVDKNSFLVETLLNSYKKYSNDYNAKAISIGGGTYAKCFKNSVAFGIKLPNEEETCHIDNEYVNIDTLKMSIKIMKDAIKELAK